MVVKKRTPTSKRQTSGHFRTQKMGPKEIEDNARETVYLRLTRAEAAKLSTFLNAAITRNLSNKVTIDISLFKKQKNEEGYHTTITWMPK